MKMTLSSNRAILATYLFQELERQSISQPNKKQIIFVPEGCMAGWLALTKALHGRKDEGGEVFVLQDMKMIQDDPSFSFHFFGFRELSVSLLPMIPQERLHWYFFSPCAHFWSDLLSEREIGKRVARVKVHSRNEVQAALDNFYLEANSLLSNAATLGREAASLLDEIPCEVEALYPVSYDILEEEIYKERLFDNELFSPTVEKKTLLHYIQSDLIFLIGAREDKKALPYEDSFTLVEAPTVRSEVSLLQEALYELSKIRPLDIGDVLILSPNPAKYEGALFDLMKEKNLKVQIVYEENPPLILKMKRWMSFLLGRFHQEDLLSLLSMPEMEPLLECDGEELQELREKIRSLLMSWGMSYEFKKNYISYHGIEAQEEKLHVGTVEDVYGTILHSLFEKNSVDVDSQSLWALSIRFFAFLKQISLLWPLPLFESSAAFLQEWVRRMKELLIFLQKGFSGDEVLILFEALSLLQDKGLEEDMLFEDFSTLFLEKIRALHSLKKRNLTGHVLLGSLLDTIPFPARMIALVGMDDDGIHDLLSQRASETDEERVKLRNRLQYAVLDSLMQAQEKFLVSHLSWDFETRQKKEPAQIVVLLSEYVESQFMIEEGSFKKQAGCLDWNFLHKKERQNFIAPLLKYKKKESAITVKKFLSALSDPLAYFMKMHYGQKKWGAFSAPPSLFATTRDLVRMVDKELLSPSRYMPKKHRKGVSQALIHKECHEMKQSCYEKMKQHLQGQEIKRQSLSFDERDLFSSVQLKGDLSLFSPVADIILVEDPKKALADIWPKLALLAGLEKELLSLHIEPAILFPLQGVKKKLPRGYSMASLEEFWLLLQETPFPFQADFLPTLMGSKGSFYAFESLLQEKIEEKNRIFTSFSFSHDATERSRLYPLWQEVAEKLIGPWYHWLEKEES